MSTSHRLLADPFLHCCALGALFFLVHAWWGDQEPAPASANITFGAADLAEVRSEWEQQSGDDVVLDLPSMVRERIDDERAAREARRLGLDADDPTIRRHLAAKLRALTDDVAALAEPSPDDLQQLYHDDIAHFTNAEGVVQDLDAVHAQVRERWRIRHREQERQRLRARLQSEYPVVWADGLDGQFP